MEDSEYGIFSELEKDFSADLSVFQSYVHDIRGPLVNRAITAWQRDQHVQPDLDDRDHRQAISMIMRSFLFAEWEAIPGAPRLGDHIEAQGNAIYYTGKREAGNTLKVHELTHLHRLVGSLERVTVGSFIGEDFLHALHQEKVRPDQVGNFEEPFGIHLVFDAGYTQSLETNELEAVEGDFICLPLQYSDLKLRPIDIEGDIAA